MRTTTRIATAGFAAAAAMTLTVGPAFAADNAWVSANLKPVVENGVKGSGTAMVEVDGTTITVTMAAMGLLPDAPHAAHIHFAAAARHECPAVTDDKSGDGTINTTEGGPAYGDIVVSLTKTGDTSPASGLAVDRFDTAPGGKISYERGSIKVSQGVADAITKGQSVVVIHGVDHNHDGKYDGDTKSDLDPSLPTEATDPALCGALRVAPAGGMHTGGGQITGQTDQDGANTGMLALGGGLLLAAAGTGAFAAKRRNAIRVGA
ncbi:hypothetical protein DFJ68_2929 [Terracoccus luteus]|uniref:CHRD domain-containing protein n=2 Tax=Terracoccus luteus TaxID=53356 RepID=A0A495XYS8_9MICO|nr:CHRD domain-containing protein [Terracoccus luteus]RKT79457.1 hypothetical protein DFJ68_2929 [Terracoccus luteus]